MRAVPGSRVGRLFVIHDAMRSTRPPLDAQGWGELLQVNERTILRDIAFLKNDLGAPVVFDTELKGYRYEDKQIQSAPTMKQSKWTRVLDLVHRIHSQPGKTAKELAEEAGIAERTFFRYLREIEKAGFPVCKEDGYRLACDSLGPEMDLSPRELLLSFFSGQTPEAQGEGASTSGSRGALERLLRATA